MWRLAIRGLVAGTVFFLNPMLGCAGGEDGESFEFGEPEMRAAVQGTYVGRLSTTGETLTLELDEATVTPGEQTIQLSKRRVQCAMRSFIRTAAACATSTTMELTGTLTSDGAMVPSASVRGIFDVGGVHLNNGWVEITFSNNAFIHANYDSQLGLTGWTISLPEASGEVTVEFQKQ